jgi:glucose/arabinose dehydrogenase
MNHATLISLLFGAVAVIATPVAMSAAPMIPATPEQVARPGGKVPGVPPLALVKIADGFADPTGVAVANDGSGRIFVVERVGRIRIVGKDGKLLPEPFIDLTKINPLGNEVQTGFVEQGLWSVAFHPKFKENGYFFIHYASLPFNGASLIVRLTVDPKSPNALSADQINKTAKVIMNIPQPYYNHYGGMIAFGPDGFLYIGKGDGGWEGDPLDAGQRLDVHWGKLLRIDVNVPDSEPYRVPPSNPFNEASKDRLMSLFGITEEGFSKIRAGAKKEIWAYGLRNPYLFHFDRKSGDLFIADVGQNHWEEIDWQPASSKGGENYGWRHNMGSKCHPLKGPDDKCPIIGVLPVAEYPHQEPYPGAPKLKDGWGCSAQGLGVANYGGMNKVYLVGDWCSGRLWAIGWDGNRWQMQEALQTNLQFTGGNVDENGMVLAVNCNCFYLEDKGATANKPGSLWRVMPRDQVPQGAQTAPVVKK